MKMDKIYANWVLVIGAPSDWEKGARQVLVSSNFCSENSSQTNFWAL